MGGGGGGLPGPRIRNTLWNYHTFRVSCGFQSQGLLWGAFFSVQGQFENLLF